MSGLNSLAPNPEAIKVMVYNNPTTVYGIKAAAGATYNVAPPSGAYLYAVSCEQNVYVSAGAQAIPPANTGVNLNPQSEINPGGARVIANSSANISFYFPVACNCSVAFYNAVV